MFAVPGWSLPTAPVTQEETFEQAGGKTGKKRKRRQPKDTQVELESPNRSAGVNGRRKDSARDINGSAYDAKEDAKFQRIDVKDDNQDGTPSSKRRQSYEDGDAEEKAWRTDPLIAKGVRKRYSRKLKDVNHKLSNIASGKTTTTLIKKKAKLERLKVHWESRIREIDAVFPQQASTTANIPVAKTAGLASGQEAPSHHTQPSKAPAAAGTPLTPLQVSMRAKLASARFRHLNEQLYTSSSSAVQKLFQDDPQMFEDYHTGFRQQVESWPENPVESFISDVRKRAEGEKSGEGKIVALPRTKGVSTIADLGAGEGRLALGLKELGVGLGKDKARGKALMGNVRVVSYDLVGKDDVVIAADIADLPLKDGSVDVAVFCLALMGTNWLDFVDEAFRILRVKGELWVAEIKSRFVRVEKAKGKPVKHSVGKKRKPSEVNEEDAQEFLDDDEDGRRDQTDVSAFLEVLRRRGFVLDQKAGPAVDLSNKMFVKMRFIKGGMPIRGKNARLDSSKPVVEKGVVKKGGKWFDTGFEEDVDETKVLKPCVYKLR